MGESLKGVDVLTGRCLNEEATALTGVAWPALTRQVHEGEFALSAGIASCGRLPVPAARSHKVLTCAVADRVEGSEVAPPQRFRAAICQALGPSKGVRVFSTPRCHSAS